MAVKYCSFLVAASSYGFGERGVLGVGSIHVAILHAYIAG